MISNKLHAIWEEERAFIPLKFIYFSLNIPFYAVYQQRVRYFQEIYHGTNLDLDANKGAIAAYGLISSLMIFFSAWFWSYVSDKLKKPKLMIGLVMLGSVVTFTCYLWPKNLTDFYLISAAFAFFSAGLTPILDSSTIALLLSIPKGSKELYGRQVVWGTIAYLISSNIAGFVANVNFSYLMYWNLASYVYGFAVLFWFFPSNIIFQQAPKIEKLPMKDPEIELKDLERNEEPQKPQVASFWGLMATPSFLYIIVAILFIGYVRAVMNYYLSAYLKGYHIASAASIGLSSWGSTIFEVTILFYAKNILSSIGPHMMMILSQLSMSVRVFSYYLVPESNQYEWTIQIIEILKGVSSALYQTSSVQLAALSAPPGLDQTVQGVVSGVYNGLSAALGSYIGGVTYVTDPKLMFLMTGVLAASSTTLLVIKYIFDRRKRARIVHTIASQ
jgi:MFS family permease